MKIVVFHQPMTLITCNTHRALRLGEPYRFVYCTACSGTGPCRFDCRTKFAAGRRLGHSIKPLLCVGTTLRPRLRSARRPLSTGCVRDALKASGSKKGSLFDDRNLTKFRTYFLGRQFHSRTSNSSALVSPSHARGLGHVCFSIKIQTELIRILPAGGESVRRFRPPASNLPL